MRHIAAYLLLQIGGNASPSAGDVKKVLSAVGIEADDERLEKLISELEGKDVNEVCITIILTKYCRDCPFFTFVI
jgi:large subunit ribosomal protein LP2